MKFFALTLLAIASSASAKIHFSGGIMRNEMPQEGKKIILELDERKVFYHDETVYIEAELIEEAADHVMLQFTVATKNETGSYMVRGLPKLAFPIAPGTRVANSSLRCDGPSESFTIIGAVERIE